MELNIIYPTIKSEVTMFIGKKNVGRFEYTKSDIKKILNNDMHNVYLSYFTIKNDKLNHVAIVKKNKNYMFLNESVADSSTTIIQKLQKLKEQIIKKIIVSTYDNNTKSMLEYSSIQTIDKNHNYKLLRTKSIENMNENAIIPLKEFSYDNRGTTVYDH